MQIAVEELQSVRFTPKSELAIVLKEKGQANLTHSYSGLEIIKIPTVDIKELVPYVKSLQGLRINQLQSITIETRFEGYVKKERQQVEKLVKLERKQIPQDIDYNKVENLATEARQKLIKVKPLNIGQASRITGVNPADIQMLLFYLKSAYAHDIQE
jgi:tRNA uridine 5-carboxymethylaminomethyl modification enzyme